MLGQTQAVVLLCEAQGQQLDLFLLSPLPVHRAENHRAERYI